MNRNLYSCLHRKYRDCVYIEEKLAFDQNLYFHMNVIYFFLRISIKKYSIIETIIKNVSAFYFHNYIFDAENVIIIYNTLIIAVISPLHISRVADTFSRQILQTFIKRHGSVSRAKYMILFNTNMFYRMFCHCSAMTVHIARG